MVTEQCGRRQNGEHVRHEARGECRGRDSPWSPRTEGVSGDPCRACCQSGRLVGEDPRDPAHRGTVCTGQVLRCRACDSQQWLQLGRLRPGQRARCSLSCSVAGRRGEGLARQPTGGSGGGGGGALRHPPLLQKFKPDWGWRAGPSPAAPLESTRLLTAAGLGVAGAPCPLQAPLPSQNAGLAFHQEGQRPRAPPCVHPRGSWKGGAGPAPWASRRRLCGPSWAGNTLMGPGCQLPVPGLGNELPAAPHDSSPGPSPQASRPPPCSAPVGCQEAHVTLWGQAPPDPSRSGAELGGAG